MKKFSYGRKGGRFLFTLGALLSLICPAAWAEQTQVDMIEYYPTNGNIPDPFHVRRLTVGAPYAAIDPPADSAIVAGSVGVNVAAPAVPLDAGPRDAVNLGGAVRLLGAGANRWRYFENNTMQLRLIVQTAAGSSERMRVLNTGRVGIFSEDTGVRDPLAPLEIGPKDGLNAGGNVFWAGALNGANPDHTRFTLENSSGKLQLSTRIPPGGTGTAGEKIRVLNNGSVGIFFEGAANGGFADPLAQLDVGPSENGGVGFLTGGVIRFTPSAGGRPFNLLNEGNAVLAAGEFQVMMDTTGGGTPATVRFRMRNDGYAAINTTTTTNARLRVAAANAIFNGTVGVKTIAPRAMMHLVDSATGPPSFYGTTVTVNSSPAANPVYQMFTTGPILRLGRAGTSSEGGVPAYIELEGGRVGFGYSAVRDAAGNPYPSTLTVNIRSSNRSAASPIQGAFYQDGAFFGVTAAIGAAEVVKINGDARAEGVGATFDNSTVQVKTDLVPLTLPEEQAILEKLLSVSLYHFRLKSGDHAKAHRLGILTEEAPAEMVDDSGQGIVQGDSLAALLAAVKAQQVEINALRSELEELRK